MHRFPIVPLATLLFRDPVLVARARELRDRWLEKVNAPGGASVLLSQGKYDVSKALPAPAPSEGVASVPLLEAAA